MARHGGILLKRQAEFLKTGSAGGRWAIRQRTGREEAFHNGRQNFIACNGGRHRPAHHARTTPGDANRHRSRRLVAQQPLFGRSGLCPQACPLVHRELLPQPPFHQVGQGQVHVVAAQHQVVAHGHPLKAGPGLFLNRGNQRKVCGATAHVAHQNGLAGPQLLLPGGGVVGDPRIKRRLRLFQQCQVFAQPGAAGGLHRQPPCGFVE